MRTASFAAPKRSRKDPGLIHQYSGGALSQVTVTAAAEKPRHYECVCDCGTAKVVLSYNLASGATKSCGCIRAEKNNNTKHSGKGTLTYKRWKSMRARCNQPGAVGYPNYGGRGIKVCDRWNDFAMFLADMQECPPDMTLDRIDPNGNYEPGNCRWATQLQQNRNHTRNRLLSFDGETLGVSVWAERLGIPAQTILNRLRYGWSVERTLTNLEDGRKTRRSKARP